MLQKAVTIESRLKDSRDAYKSHRQNVHFVGDCSDDDNKEFLAAEIKWPVENKLVTCPSPKPIHKNRNEEIKFTFDFSKCD